MFSLKKKTVLLFVATWMNWRHYAKLRDTEKDSHYMIPLM